MSKSQSAATRLYEIRFATDRGVVSKARRIGRTDREIGMFMAGYLYARKVAKIVRKK